MKARNFVQKPSSTPTLENYQKSNKDLKNILFYSERVIIIQKFLQGSIYKKNFDGFSGIKIFLFPYLNDLP